MPRLSSQKPTDPIIIEFRESLTSVRLAKKMLDHSELQAALPKLPHVEAKKLLLDVMNTKRKGADILKSLYLQTITTPPVIEMALREIQKEVPQGKRKLEKRKRQINLLRTRLTELAPVENTESSHDLPQKKFKTDSYPKTGQQLALKDSTLSLERHTFFSSSKEQLSDEDWANQQIISDWNPPSEEWAEEPIFYIMN